MSRDTDSNDQSSNDSNDVSMSRRRALAAAGVAAGIVGTGGAYSILRSGNGSEGPSDGVGLNGSFEITNDVFLDLTGETPLGIELDNRPVMGSREAPVDVYYWGDVLCPYCRAFEEDIFPSVGERYIGGGDMRMVFLQFPVASEYSPEAALWDRSVWQLVKDTEPVQYWEWRNAVFDRHPESGEEWASDEEFIEITDGVSGVDADGVVEFIEADREGLETLVLEDASAAETLTIESTPSFVFHNAETDTRRGIAGVRDEEAFIEEMEAVLD